MSFHENDSMPPGDYDSQRLIDLVNRDFDQQLSPAEQDELTSLLTESESARVLHMEMQKLLVQLNELPEREPPAYLNSSITNNIRVSQIQSSATEESHSPGLFTSLIEAISPRAGFATAALVVLMLGIYQFDSENAPQNDTERLAGSMLPDTSHSLIIDSFNIVNDKMTAVAELHRKQDLYVLELHLKAEAPFEVALHLAGSGLKYRDIQTNSDWVPTQEGRSIITDETDLHYELILEKTKLESVQNHQPLKMVFSRDSKVIMTAELNSTAVTR